MAIKELTDIISPPVGPLHNDIATLRAAEAELGIALPSDYVDLARVYGTGCFGDPTYYFWINNPLHAAFSKRVNGELQFWRECHDSFPDEYPCPIFPETPGCLPLGGDVDGGLIGYIVDGDPNSWPVIAKSVDGTQYQKFNMPLTTFLAAAIRQDIRPEWWRPDFPEDPTNVTFVPGEQYHQSVTHRS